MQEAISLKNHISTFVNLGERLRSLSDDQLEALYVAASGKNNWFTRPNIEKAILAIAGMLNEDALTQWTKHYALPNEREKNIGIVMAGNIPLVGFHDLLSVLIAGHTAKIKLSSQDEVLMKFVIDQLLEVDAGLQERIEICERLTDTDAVIATGSDNSARYFKHYFGKAPHIIRQNRTSVAILNGSETEEAIEELGSDIFQYFGLGCRNVSKLYVPVEFDLTILIDALMPFEAMVDHHKYRNNYDYNKSIYLVNGEEHLDSGFFLVKESQEFVSPISVLFYEKYESETQLDFRLSENRDKIQAILSTQGWYEGSIPFGTAQQPELWDYADGVDTLEFLCSL